MSKVKVGVLGSGDVGKSFARAFAALGHEVMIGSRSPEKLNEFASGTAGVRSGTFEEAAKFGDLIALATLGTATTEALRLAGTQNFDGKVLIDATNPLDFSTGAPRLAVSGTSASEEVQKWLPGAHVVKAFNIVGNAHMVDPQFPGGPPDMFIAGNDAGAKETVTGILRDFGWDVIDLGGIESSRYLESLAMIWILHYFQTKNGNHAFKLLKK